MSDAQLDIMIEKLDQIIEHLMLGGVTSEAPDRDALKGMTRETLEMRDTDVVLGRACGVCGAHHHSASGAHVHNGGVTGQFPGLRATPEVSDDEVARWEFPSGGTRTLEVTKRGGVVIDVKIL